MCSWFNDINDQTVFKVHENCRILISWVSGKMKLIDQQDPGETVSFHSYKCIKYFHDPCGRHTKGSGNGSIGCIIEFQPVKNRNNSCSGKGAVTIGSRINVFKWTLTVTASISFYVSDNSSRSVVDRYWYKRFFFVSFSDKMNAIASGTAGSWRFDPDADFIKWIFIINCSSSTASSGLSNSFNSSLFILICSEPDSKIVTKKGMIHIPTII